MEYREGEGVAEKMGTRNGGVGLGGGTESFEIRGHTRHHTYDTIFNGRL